MGLMGLLSIATGTLLAAMAAHSPCPRSCVDLATIMVEARRLPADVTVFAFVEDAVDIRQELAPRPISRWVNGLLNEGAVGEAWAGLARGAGMSESELFDLCFGRGFCFASRPAGQAESAEWVVTARLEESAARDLLRRMKARVREPRFGLAVSQLPEQRLLLANDGELIVIGPEAQPALFDDVLQRIGAADLDGAGLATLASDADLRQRAPELLEGMDGARVAVFVRHERPLGGCSLIVADIRGEAVRVRHAGRFDNPLFTSPITRLTCDFSPVAEFQDKSLVALMQPRDVGEGPVETFLSASLGGGLVSAEMRKNLADRRLLIVGEQDGRQLPDPSDILTTTFVAAMELKDPSIAVGQLDDQMIRLTRSMNNLHKGAMVIEPPNVRALTPCEPRHVDLGEAGKWFSGGFPVMKTVSLNWGVANGPHGAWFVVGSHPLALRETVQTLNTSDGRSLKAMRGKFDSCGVANGLRVGRHIENLSDEAQAFTEPEDLDKVRSGLQILSDLACGVQSCRWQMARPTVTSVRLDVDITLAPAQTSDEK
jgi:hypothetical protein